MEIMLEFLKDQSNFARTENYAASYSTTMSDCLDLFATIGALRREPESEIKLRFDRAWGEDANLALKTLFFARDIRGGLGERRVFRTILSSMAYDNADTVVKNLWAVPEFGRYDDLLVLLDTPVRAAVLEYIREQFEMDMTALQNEQPVSLLGKWLPSINAHNADTVRRGRIVAKALDLNESNYRRVLSMLRNSIKIIENDLRMKNYTFDYSKQPSNAMLKYRKAFLRNDNERYKAYLAGVERGDVKMNTATLLPYEIIRPLMRSGYRQFNITADERYSMDVTWKAQADYTRDENALVVVDGSGSMYDGGDPLPAAVAMSLGVYFAERNKGLFHNHFITFSENPRLIEIKGKDIYEKVKYCSTFNEVANTNIEAVFELILSAAHRNDLKQSELPATLYIISDMEFDFCISGADITNFENAKKRYARLGYKLPAIVFWNVASRNKQQPVTMNERGVALVSGSSPRLFQMITSGNLTPMALMLDILNNERYARIQV